MLKVSIHPLYNTMGRDSLEPALGCDGCLRLPQWCQIEGRSHAKGKSHRASGVIWQLTEESACPVVSGKKARLRG